MSNVRLPINYGDNGRVARDKINDSFNDVVNKVLGYRPHIESGIWRIGDTNTGIKAEGDSIDMKVESGYIWYKSESKSNWTQIIAIADLKGDKGDPGTDGQDGEDGNGIASITSSKVGKTTTVTITETNGDSESFQILDGEDGSASSGDVKGPSSSTDGNVVVFDGTTGKLIKDGSVALSTLSSAASLASTAIQPGDDISDLNNDSGFITGIDSGDVTTALGYTPYNSTNPDGYITSSDIPTDVSDFNNDAGYLTSSTGVTSVNGSHGAVSLTIPSISTITVTLTSAGWSSKTQTVSATGVTASNTVIVSPDPSDFSDYTDSIIYCSAQGSGTLTFSCDTEPTNDIDVNVVILS